MEIRYWSLTLTPLLALCSYAVLSVLVLRKAVTSHLQRSFVFYLSVMGLWSLGSAMMRLDSYRILSWNRVLTGAGAVIPFAFYLFVKTFLNEKPRHWLWLGLVGLIALEVSNLAGLMVTGAQLLDGGLLSFDVGPAAYSTALYGMVFYFLSAESLVQAYLHNPDPPMRNRIRYLAVGVFFVLLGGSTNVIPALGALPIDHAANFLNALLLTYAVLRFQLVDITLVVRKGLLYSIPTIIIGISYFLIISAAANLFHVFAGPEIFVLSLVVAAVAAIVAQPLRDRAQLWIDRAFFREKYDASLMLQRVSRTAASVLDLDELTSMILDGLGQTMHIERLAFFLRQEDSDEFRLAAQRGIEHRHNMRLRSDHPLVRWLSRREEVVTHRDMDLIPQFKALWGAERADLERMGCELFVALHANGQLVGILAVGPKMSGEAYSQDDHLTLTTLANQTATALENARLHGETHRRYRELALLNRIIAASATGQPMASVLATACRELAQAFDVPQATTMLLNEDKTQLEIAAAYPTAFSTQKQSRILITPHQGDVLPVTEIPWMERLLAQKQPVTLNGDRRETEWAARHHLKAMLALPLVVDDDIVGSLNLSDTVPHAFSDNEISLAWRVAEQVSGALARSRLAETQRRLSAAIEQSAEAVLIADIHGTVLYANSGFERITGYSRSSVVGQGPQDHLTGAAQTILHPNVWPAVRSGQIWQEQLQLERADGSPATLDLTVSPVRNACGEILNFVATMRDVTREVQLEQQFYQSQKMEALGRFAGGIAHDFNNLLTILHLGVRLLQRQLPEDHPAQAQVQQIEDTNQRASKLTQQLLRFSRREVVEPRTLNLNRVITDLGEILERLLSEDITLVTELEDELWMTDVDPAQIEQVIMNLAVNARDAMPQGGSLTIRSANMVVDSTNASSRSDVSPGEYVMLSITDTGTGMSEQVKSHLFEPFFTTKERGRGTGLGLSTVFGIVTQHEGHIQVDSQVDQGTTVCVYLPRSKKATPWGQSAPTSKGTTRGSGTVLVVEDEADVRKLTVKVLRSNGYNVLAASNGREAIQVSKTHSGPIDLLLTDIVMPEMGGSELVSELQPQRPEMRILYMSGYADRPMVNQSLADPSVAFLSKPFSMETLTKKMQDILEE